MGKSKNFLFEKTNKNINADTRETHDTRKKKNEKTKKLSPEKYCLKKMIEKKN